jgi:hypothetical protein
MSEKNAVKGKHTSLETMVRSMLAQYEWERTREDGTKETLEEFIKGWTDSIIKFERLLQEYEMSMFDDD